MIDLLQRQRLVEYETARPCEAAQLARLITGGHKHVLVGLEALHKSNYTLGPIAASRCGVGCPANGRDAAKPQKLRTAMPSALSFLALNGEVCHAPDQVA